MDTLTYLFLFCGGMFCDRVLINNICLKGFVVTCVHVRTFLFIFV